jgi:hypothetical protein
VAPPATTSASDHSEELGWQEERKVEVTCNALASDRPLGTAWAEVNGGPTAEHTLALRREGRKEGCLAPRHCARASISHRSADAPWGVGR